MSKQTVAVLFFVALALGVACLGLVLMLSPAAHAGESEAQPSADVEREPRPPGAPESLPAAGSGGLADAPATTANRRPVAARNDLTPLFTSLVVTAVLGLAGWATVRRWFPPQELRER